MIGTDAGAAEFGTEWHRFINEIEVIARSGLGDATIAEKIAPLLKRLLDREREGAADHSASIQAAATRAILPISAAQGG